LFFLLIDWRRKAPIKRLTNEDLNELVTVTAAVLHQPQLLKRLIDLLSQVPRHVTCYPIASHVRLSSRCTQTPSTMPCLQRVPSRLLRLARITSTRSDVRSVLIPWRGRHTAGDTSNAAFCDIDAEPLHRCRPAGWISSSPSGQWLEVRQIIRYCISLGGEDKLLFGLLKIIGQSRHPGRRLDDWLLMKNQTATTSRDQGPRLRTGPRTSRGHFASSSCQ